MATTGKRIADAIEERMEALDISRNALSETTGIPYNTLKGRLNTGHNLEVEELRLIAEALGTEPHKLWEQALSPKALAA
jgi:lambda repressor-like predicted transcriptional regulator